MEVVLQELWVHFVESKHERYEFEGTILHAGKIAIAIREACSNRLVNVNHRVVISPTLFGWV
jgi:hypothetical protein